MTNRNAIIMVSLLCFILAFPWSKNVAADTIYLKDGTKEQSDRVWESGNYIHFVLKGTKNVEIRVAKDFVDHIERESKTGRLIQPPAEVKSNPASEQRKKPKADNDNAAVPKKDQIGRDRPFLDSNTVEKNKGLSFYDPRRPRRYWAEKSAKFRTLEEALSELARRYNHSVAWVQQNMGEENDLGMIHYHLMQKLKSEQHSEASSKVDKGELSPEKQPDATATSAERQKTPSRGDHATAMLILGKSSPDAVGGPLFYDPRRKKKYWISPSNGFDTLSEALNALSQAYHVPVDWIEQHMGDSNHIEDIHRSIRKSLPNE